MAITDGRTLLDNANAVTNWGTYPADATAPNVEGDTVKFGSASMALTADNTGGTEGICYDELADRDWTDEIVYMWVNIANPGLMETKADGGIKVRVANNAGISNFAERFVDGSDTYTGGWKMFVLDMNDICANPDLTGGTPPVVSALRYVGIVVDLITGAMPKMQDNLFIDISWRLAFGTPGIIVEDGTFDWSDVVLAGDEFDLTKAWGHIREESGDIRLSSSIEFGDSGATTTTFLDAAGRNVKFVEPNNPLPDDIFAVTFVGNGTGTTDIDFGAVVGTGDDRQGVGGTNWDSEGPAYTMDGDTDIADLDTLNFYGGSINRSGDCDFSSSTKTDIIGVTFNECGEIRPNDAEFLNNFMVSPSDRGFEYNATNNIKNITCVAGGNVNEVGTFGTRTNSDNATPSDPETFTHTIATGEEDVALLVFVGFEHTADALLGITYGEVGTPATVRTFSLERVGTVSFGTTITVEAWILYDPPENVAHTLSLNFSVAVDNVGVSAYNLEGVNRFSELSVFSNTATAATAVATTATDQSTSNYTVDMVYADVSGPGTTFSAAGGDATETRDVAVGGEASYATSEDTAGLGDRVHDWTWTGSANAAQLVVSVKSIGLEHSTHLSEAVDTSITYDNIQFFGFGASGTPKWHGENSGSGADRTVAASNGSNPAEGEFESTNGGTVAVTNAVTVRVEGLTEGAAASVIASELVGTQRIGDVIMEELANASGVAEITDFNYEGAFDPSGLDVVVRARQAGLPNGAQVSDNGSFTDWTPEANASALGFGASFGGTSEFLSRGADLTGLSDSAVGTLSFWFKRGATGSQQVIMQDDNATPRFLLEFTAGNDIRLAARNTSGTIVLDIETTTAITDTDLWHHCLIAWDLGVAAESFIYIDGAEDTTRTTHTAAETLDLTTNVTDWGIGDEPGGTGNNLNGNLAEFWFTTTYVDPTVTKNRREFRTVNGIPAYLGADGAQPTGTAAIVYLGGTSRFATWQVNRGTGGGFTENGTLGDGGNATDVIMYPATPVIDQDSFYIGHAEQSAGIKLHLVVAAGGSPTITPQYWNGAWVNLSGVVDNTSNLTTLGENKITWTLPGDWATSTEGGLGPFFWMRLLFDAGTLTTNPELRKAALDVTRYLPFIQNRIITSSGLTVVATWVVDSVAEF